MKTLNEIEPRKPRESDPLLGGGEIGRRLGVVELQGRRLHCYDFRGGRSCPESIDELREIGLRATGKHFDAAVRQIPSEATDLQLLRMTRRGATVEHALYAAAHQKLSA